MEAIILAGGLGTRLRKVVADLPKPMAPVNGKPFLHYLFQWLGKYNASTIVISAGYRHEVISRHFGDSFSGIPLEYVIEEKPLGTGGAVIRSLKSTEAEDVLIVNGDTWFPIDLYEFHSRHAMYGHIFSIALKRMHDFSRYGAVETDGYDITGFSEKKHTAGGLINGGIYLVKRSFFEARQFPEVFSLEKDLLTGEAGKHVLKGVVFDDPFIDIGIPEEYLRAGSVIGDE
jgi:D-glycero-alpha-D-manno-heptose 1-phosphate guanylyltransferase